MTVNDSEDNSSAIESPEELEIEAGQPPLGRREIRTCRNLDIKHLSRVTEVTLERGGVRLVNYLYSNPASDQLLVLCPGFGKSGHGSAYQWLARTLCERHEVLAISFRGHGHSGGRFSFGLWETEDLLAVIAYALSPRHKEVLILGFSLGGTLALSVARSTQLELGRTTRVMTVSAPLMAGSFRFDLKALPCLPRLIMSKPIFAMPKISFASIRHLRHLFHSASLGLDDAGIECILVFCKEDWLIDLRASLAHIHNGRSKNTELVVIDAGGPMHAEDLLYLHCCSFLHIADRWVEHKTI